MYFSDITISRTSSEETICFEANEYAHMEIYDTPLAQADPDSDSDIGAFTSIHRGCCEPKDNGQIVFVDTPVVHADPEPDTNDINNAMYVTFF